MSSKKVLGVFVVALIVMFICISIDFGLVLASTRSIVVIEKPVNQDEKAPVIANQNDVEANYSGLINDHNSDYLDFNLKGIESAEFTPNLYEWLWENLPAQ